MSADELSAIDALNTNKRGGPAPQTVTLGTTPACVSGMECFQLIVTMGTVIRRNALLSEWAGGGVLMARRQDVGSRCVLEAPPAEW